MRTFVAIEFDPDLRRALGRVAARGAWQGAAVRWVDESRLHLTLRFLGEVDESRIPDVTTALRAATQGQSPFCLRLRGLGTFPGEPRPPRVLWAGVERCPELNGLVAGMEVELRQRGFVPERREFAAHVTLARVRGGARSVGSRVRFPRNEREPEFGEQEVQAITLMESVPGPKGPEYRPLARFCLGEERP